MINETELNGDGKVLPAGVYKHPETGKEIIAKLHPKWKDAQARGFARVGFVYDRPAPKETEEVSKEVEAEPEEAKPKASKK